MTFVAINATAIRGGSLASAVRESLAWVVGAFDVEDYPLGRVRTKISVRNRGPYVRGRTIDLSRAAVRRLGILRTGTARVRIETID